MISSKVENGILCLGMSGSLPEIGAELATILYAYQKKARQELGRENGDAMVHDIVSVIESGSKMRKMTKKATAKGKEIEL